VQKPQPVRTTSSRTRRPLETKRHNVTVHSNFSYIFGVMKLPFWNKADRPAVDTTSVVNEIAPHFELGRRGEELAIEYLERAGYHIVAANFNVPIGRNMRDVIVNAEIDIVAYDGPTLCFVEVKSRASDEFAPPQVNVDLRKRRQIARAAMAYRRMFGLVAAPHRYDVVTVVTPSVEKPGESGMARLELLRNFWTDDRLRKKKWHEARWD
jgi:putative endonuclease